MIGNIGVTGLLLILIVALLLFGPNKLPELGRAFGKTLREFKKGASEIIDDTEQDNQRKPVQQAELTDNAAIDTRNDQSRRLPE